MVLPADHGQVPDNQLANEWHWMTQFVVNMVSQWLFHNKELIAAIIHGYNMLATNNVGGQENQNVLRYNNHDRLHWHTT